MVPEKFSCNNKIKEIGFNYIPIIIKKDINQLQAYYHNTNQIKEIGSRHILIIIIKEKKLVQDLFQ